MKRKELILLLESLGFRYINGCYLYEEFKIFFAMDGYFLYGESDKKYFEYKDLSKIMKLKRSIILYKILNKTLL